MRLKVLGYLTFVMVMLVSCEKYSLNSLLDKSNGKKLDVSFATSINNVLLNGDDDCSLVDCVDFSIFKIEGCDSVEEAYSKLNNSKKYSYSLFYHKEQSNLVSDFGTINVKSIPFGIYLAVAVGHSDSIHAQFHSPIQVDFNGSVPITYCCSKLICISDTTSTRQSLPLDLITGRFSFNYTSSMNSYLKYLVLQTSGCYLSFNPLTGYAPEKRIISREMNYDISTNQKNNSFSFNTFLPNEDNRMFVIVSGLDREKSLLWTKSFDNVVLSCGESYECE